MMLRSKANWHQTIIWITLWYFPMGECHCHLLDSWNRAWNIQCPCFGGHDQPNKLNCSPVMKCTIDQVAPLNAFLCLQVVEVHCIFQPLPYILWKNLKWSWECCCRALLSPCILSMRIFSHTWQSFLGLEQVLLIELCIKCYNIAKFPKVILKVFMNRAFSFHYWKLLLLELSQVP